MNSETQFNNDLGSSFSDLLDALAQLEQYLENFKHKIEPEVQRLGFNISMQSLKLGMNLQQTAVNNYNNILTKIGTQGYYTNNDINNLYSAINSSSSAMQVAKIGALIGGVIWLGGKIYAKVKEFLVKQKMKAYIDEEKKRSKKIREILFDINARIKQNQLIRIPLFEKIGMKIPNDVIDRKNIDNQIHNAIEGFKKISEIESRSLYIDDIYDAIDNFDYDKFQNSLNELFFVGFQKKGFYYIKSLDYTNHIEALLQKVKWNKPYYENGLPGIIIYSLKNQKNPNFLPKGYKSYALKKHIKQIRLETLKAFLPISLIKAYRYSKSNFGKLLDSFQYHFRIVVILLFIICGYVTSSFINIQSLSSISDVFKTSDSKPDSLKLLNKAIMYFSSNDYNKSLIEFNNYMSYYPSDSKIYFNRALVYNRLSKFQNSIDDLVNSIQLDSNFADAHLLMASNYAMINENRKSIFYLKNAMKLDIKNRTNKDLIEWLRKMEKEK